MADLATVTPQRILICQQRQIGDVLLLTPALELLHQRFPQAEIHLFTEAKCEPLLRHNPHITRFHLLHKQEQPTLFSQLVWYRDVARHHFDLVIDFQQLPRCRMMTRFSRAPVRLSFPAPWYRSLLYTHTAAPVPGYAAQTKASILAPLGISWQGEAPRIYLQAEETEAAATLLQDHGVYVGPEGQHRLITVDATHRRSSKQWPRDRFIQLINALGRQHPDLRFLLLRGPGEEEEVNALRHACAHPHHVLVPQPAPDLRLSAACMSLAALHLGNCSSPRHMAVALGIPSVVIPGASGPEWTYPSPRHVELRPALPCQPCSKIQCSQPVCLHEVTVDQVLSAANGLLV